MSKILLRDVDCILVTVRIFGHEPLIKSCLSYYPKNMMIIIFTGYWAALRLRTLFLKSQRTDITIAETTLLPLASKIAGPEYVKISRIKSKIRIATYLTSKTSFVYRNLRSSLPQLFPGNNVLETSLENFNPILHVPIALFNLGEIEKKENTFKFYHEGISPKIVRIIDAVDTERMKLT